MKLFQKLPLLLVLIIILSFISCNTNPPVAPPLPETGNIFVTSNVEGARIFIDNNYTGKLTPDTITASTGTHLIELEKDNYSAVSIQVQVIKDSTVNAALQMVEAEAPKIILIEDFANVSCAPCVVSNRIMRSLNQYTYGPTKIITIKFPTNFPGPNDPLYLVNKPNSDARKTFYNVNSAPTIVVDGILKPAPSDSVKIKEAINTQLLLKGKFTITLSDTLIGSTVMVKAVVKPVNTIGLTFNNLVLHTVLVEKVVTYATPPGSNGETEFYDVIRAMTPDANGKSLTASNQSESVEYSGQFSITGYNPANMEIVVFIQDKNTKQVYQTAAKGIH